MLLFPPFFNLPGLFIAKPRANSSWTASLETWKLVSQSAKRVGGPYAAHLTAGAADIDPPHVLSVAEGSLDDPHGLQQLTFQGLIEPPPPCRGSRKRSEAPVYSFQGNGSFAQGGEG